RSHDAPAKLEERKGRLLDELAAAEARRAQAADALAAVEDARTAADRALRQAEAAAGEARENRAGLAAKRESALERWSEIAAQIRETARIEPGALGRQLAEEAVAIPADPAGMEAHLYN